MNKEQQIEKLSKKLIELIDRETIDKFIEDEEGNLKEIRTYSVYEIAKSLYNIGWRQVGDIEENFISKKALIACENNKGATEHLLMVEKVINEVRKETAKEMLTRIKNMYKENGFCINHTTKLFIEQLAKEYGVEIGQCETVCPVCGKEMDGTEHGRQYCEDCKAKFEGKE